MYGPGVRDFYAKCFSRYLSNKKLWKSFFVKPRLKFFWRTTGILQDKRFIQTVFDLGQLWKAFRA